MKVSLYMDEALHDDIAAVARRLDRSMSQAVEYAWRIARDRLAAAPTHRDPPLTPRRGE